MNYQEQLSFTLNFEHSRKCRNKKLFTKLDLHWGYDNIWINKSNKQNVVFITLEGFFEPIVIFFDLMNSFATFQTYHIQNFMIDTSRMQHGLGVKGNDDMIGCTARVSVSTSYSRCHSLAQTLCTMTYLSSCITDVILMYDLYIQHRYYSVFLYFTTYTFPLLSPQVFT